MRLAHGYSNTRFKESIPGGSHRYAGSTLFTDFIRDILAWFPSDEDGFSAVINNGNYTTVISPSGDSGAVLSKTEIEAGIPVSKISILSVVNGEAVANTSLDFTVIKQILVTPGKITFYLKGDLNTVGIFLRKGMLQV